MKAAVFTSSDKPLEIQDVPRPQAGPGELLLKVAACGICGSDLHAAQLPSDHSLSTGQILGHEYAGEVVEIGPGVTGDWQIGDRVTAMGAKFCGSCPACQRAEVLECPSLVLQGYDLRMQGAYAEYVTCFAPLAVKLPEGIDLLDAAIVEPLCVGLSGWRLGEVPTGGSVLIIGAGPIGLALTKWARFFGARDIVVSEMVPSRRERAQQMGATLVIDAAAEENPVAAMERETGRRPTVIFECVGRPMFQQLAAMAPAKAHIVMCGTCMEPESFTVTTVAARSPRVSFLLGMTMEDFHFALEMLLSKRVRVDDLRTATISLDEVPGMFEELHHPNDHCKVVITP